MKKIGIFGGTFNPVHLGHLALVEQIKQKKSLDEVLIIPTSRPPHKKTFQLASDAHRLQMCRLMFEGRPGYVVSDLECRKGGLSYTVDTVRTLKQQHPDDQLYLIMGSDMLLTFDQWFQYATILQHAAILAGAREEQLSQQMADKAAELSQIGRVEVVPIDITPMSSTEIRSRVLQGLDCDEWLGRPVFAYVKGQQLYRDSNQDPDVIELIARQMLKPSRYQHTLCVANMACALAKSHDANAHKAILAGLMHDLMKNKPDDFLLHYLTRNGIILTVVEKQNPQLWHAMASAVYIRERLGVQDLELIDAVRYHTTGRARMTQLEKIVYVADCISEDRHYDGVDKLRVLAFENLDQALAKCLYDTICRLKKTGRSVHPDSMEAYRWLIGTLEVSS